MLDLFDEFSGLVGALNQREIRYALCGGMAMAVYGVPRATEDIDLLIHGDELEKTLSAVKELGYSARCESMKFARGVIRIERVAKVDSETGDVLVLDPLLVTPEINAVWDSKQSVEWDRGELWVVSREGLIALKALRNSGQDQDDIGRLKESLDEG